MRVHILEIDGPHDTSCPRLSPRHAKFSNKSHQVKLFDDRRYVTVDFSYRWPAYLTIVFLKT